ncbi:hypothetical protein DL546_009406 [Coniochaeta pulveracea]|uniref:Uncharacterized protein n=1 Tax=Coniochaeta pulveracea TaxID=177199 RepID=A0A420YMD8_9PEZI|nr:hypothetical protein DL546_009406 [Coniochaeta pulveracea]
MGVVLLTVVVEVECSPLVKDVRVEGLIASVDCDVEADEAVAEDVVAGEDVLGGDTEDDIDDVTGSDDGLGSDDALGFGDVLVGSLALSGVVLDVCDVAMLMDGIVGKVTSGDVLVDGGGGGPAL